MKKYKRYSAGFKEQALVKVYSRGNNQSIQSVANELNINLTTLKTWMKQSEQDVNKSAQPKSKRPEDWSPEERLAALQQSYGLLGEDLNTWCRERGVFIHQLEQWKTDFCSHGGAEDQREEARVLRALKTENQTKSDFIPHPELLDRQKELIVWYWNKMNEYDPDIFMKQIRYSLIGKDADIANWQERAFTSLRKKCEYLINVLGYQSWSNP
jgi:transposase-like protein